jgi:hypothetical protein
MIGQCISAVCTLGVVILAILIMTRAISLEDALTRIGKALLALVLVYVGVCALTPLLRAGLTAFAAMLKTAVRWLAVAIFVVLPVTLLVWALLSRSIARPNQKSVQDQGDV